jgi:hypothetical protein
MDRMGAGRANAHERVVCLIHGPAPVGCRSSTLTAIPRSVMHRPAAAGRDIQSGCATEEAGGLT